MADAQESRELSSSGGPATHTGTSLFSQGRLLWPCDSLKPNYLRDGWESWAFFFFFLL